MRFIVYGSIAVLLCGCSERTDSLTLFCAAGMRPPITAAAEAFQESTGHPVAIQFGGSGTLLSQLAMGKADLFLAADSHFIDLAEKRSLVSRRERIAEQTPVLVLRSEVTGLNSISDLGGTTLRVGIGDRETSAIGRITQVLLEDAGLGEDFKPTATFATVFELANALDLGTIDAAIVWDNVAARYPEFVVVSRPEFSRYRSAIEVAVLKASRTPDIANRLCDFLRESPEVRRILAESGLSLPES